MDNQQERVEARKALEAANSQPWTLGEYQKMSRVNPWYYVQSGEDEYDIGVSTARKEDAYLIANAPTWLRNSLDREEQLIKDRDEWRKVSDGYREEMGQLIVENERQERRYQTFAAKAIECAKERDYYSAELSIANIKVAEQDKELSHWKEQAQRNERLERKAYELIDQKDKEIQRLKRKIMILETDSALVRLEEENPVRFKMDVNGHLTRIDES